MTIPRALETDWATSIRNNCFKKISEHDHTGSNGKGIKLTGSSLAADSIDGTHIELANDQYLESKDNAGTGNVNIVKINTSDLIEFGTTLSSPVMLTPQIQDASSDHQYVFAGSELAANRTITLPLLSGNDTFVFESHAQTLSNKTLTAPIISTISNTGTITLPTATDTLVARATTDTLTNKTINADNNTLSNIANAQIKAGAAIAVNKLAALTASRLLLSDASGFLTASSVTSTEAGYLSGVTSAIQTQIDGKMVNPLTTTGDILYSSSGTTAARLGVGSSGDVLTVSSGIPSWAAPAAAIESTTTKTTTYTATTADDVIFADTSGGDWTLTLYAASTNAGRKLKIVKTTSDSNVLTIDGNSSETINGATTYLLHSQYQTVELCCNGTNWVVENRTIPSKWESWTPTGTWTTNATYSGYKRRVGDSCEYQVKVSVSGTPNATTLRITIPETMDTSKFFAEVDDVNLGLTKVKDASSGNRLLGGVSYSSSTQVNPKYLLDSAVVEADTAITSTTPLTWASGDEVFISFKVPISGWEP